LIGKNLNPTFVQRSIEQDPASPPQNETEQPKPGREK
jgi:hypothetical protein